MNLGRLTEDTSENEAAGQEAVNRLRAPGTKESDPKQTSDGPPGLRHSCRASPMTSDTLRKCVDLPTLLAIRAGYRQARQTVVWTNGCFDLLHAGHVRSLGAARAFGDVLIVGLNSDRSVGRLKGPARPILAEADRATLLADLECVDHVLLFDDLVPTSLLEQLRPDVHCKGADYAPPHGKPIPERSVVEAYGGRVAFLPLLPGISTSELIRRIRQLDDLAASAHD